MRYRFDSLLRRRDGRLRPILFKERSAPPLTIQDALLDQGLDILAGAMHA